jgi:hypothetical protein
MSKVTPGALKSPVTAFSLVLATQALDALGVVLATGHGHEANPMMAALLSVGAGPMLLSKMGAAVVVAVGAAYLSRYWRSVPAMIGLVGCVGCLSALLAVVGV